MTPMGVRNGRSNNGGPPQGTRAHEADQLAELDGIMRGVHLPVRVWTRLRTLLLNSIEEIASLRNKLARSAGRLQQRDRELDQISRVGTKGEVAMRKENAALQSQMAALKREHQMLEHKIAAKKEDGQGLENHRTAMITLRKRNADLNTEALELRKEVSFLRGIVDDREEGGLVALLEGGKKLCDQHSDRVDELTNKFTARIEEAGQAAELARQEKDEAVSALKAKCAQEKDEAMTALQKDFNTQLQEKNGTIPTLTAMGRPVQARHYPHFMGVAPAVQHLPNVESTLQFVQSLQRDVEARDKTIANLQASEAKTQVKQAEMVAFNAARKTSQLELQKRFDGLKNAHEELTSLVSDSQKLIGKLNQEHESLVRELGRKL